VTITNLVMKTAILLLLINCQTPVFADDNDLLVRGYLEMAYEQNSSIEGKQTPDCSEGVRAIANAQQSAKDGSKEGIERALSISQKYVESSPPSWESDILKIGIALNGAALGDFERGAFAAERALKEVDFDRLQSGNDNALVWLREKFAGERFAQSSKDYMHRLAAAYYMDYSMPKIYDSARSHLELISDAKTREALLAQLDYRIREEPLSENISTQSNDSTAPTKVKGKTVDRQIWTDRRWLIASIVFVSGILMVVYFWSSRHPKNKV